MAFGLLNATIPSPGPVINLFTGPTNKLTVGKVTIGSKNYNPSRIQLGYRFGSDVRYFEYNRYIKYGEVIETENIYLGAGQELVCRSTETDVNFLFYGETINDVINPVRSGVLSHTISTGVLKQSLFTAPAGSESKVTLSVCNLGPDVATVKLGISEGGVSNFDSDEYLDYGFQIGPGQTYTRPDIKLGAGQSLIGFSNTGSKVTFLCHGRLYYAISGLPTSDDFVVLGNTRLDGNLGLGKTASTKLDVLGNSILTGTVNITGDTKIKSVNYNEDIDNVRNLRTIGISTFTGDVIIKGDTTDIKSHVVRTKSKDIILGVTETENFVGSISAGSSIVTNCNPTDNLTPTASVSLAQATGNLDLGTGVNIVSVASSTITLSEVITGNGVGIGTFVVGDPTNITADRGGIIIRGTTDKSILWEDSNDRFHFSSGITLDAGRLQIMDGTAHISIGITNVISANTILGRELTDEIVVSNDNTNYIPTAIAVTKRARNWSAEQYFLTGGW